MKKKRLLVLVLVSLFLITSLGNVTFAIDKFKEHGTVTVFRDHYGVPHIYAKETYELFYGYGYAIAMDRLFQMEMSKRTVKGTVAEVLGAGDNNIYINFDKGVRSNYSPASIQQQYQALPKYHKDIFDGYAAGINARIEQVIKNQAILLPKEFTDYGFLPTKWTAFDVIMVFVGTMANRFSDFNGEIGNLAYLEYLKSQYSPSVAKEIFDQTKWINDPGAPTTVPHDECGAARAQQNKALARHLEEKRPGIQVIAASQTGQLTAQKEVLARVGMASLTEAPFASNVWLVGEKKTKGKGSILFNGPQFGWFNPGYVYEIGLHGAGFDVVGSSPFGYPAILFGHNAFIAWGSTAGLGDLVDIYEEDLDPSNPYRYFFNGQLRDMEKKTEIIQVKGGSPVTLDIYRTVHGFVVSFDTPNHKAYSKKRTWEGYEVESLIGWIESTKAQNYWEWRRNAAKMAITINWYYGDRYGNIGYIHTGKYPIRLETQDLRLPASGKGDMEWIGILPFRKNPQVYNPEQAYITNWNNKPAIYWNDADFTTWGSADRVNAIIHELEAQKKFNKDEIWDINRRVSFIDLNIGYFLPFLEKAVESYPNTPEAHAVEMLKDWDGYRVDLTNDGFYDSPAQTIFEKWLGVMLERTLKDDIKDYFSIRGYGVTGYPKIPPSGSTNVQTGTKILYHALLGHDSTVPNKYDFFNNKFPLNEVFAALTDTITALTMQFGTSDMTKWLTPVVKQQFFYKNFNGIPQASPNENLFLPINMNRGTQNHMVVLTPHGVHGENVCPPGESGFVAPGGGQDAHYQDQMELYRTFESKPMLFQFDDILKNLESAEVLYIN